MPRRCCRHATRFYDNVLIDADAVAAATADAGFRFFYATSARYSRHTSRQRLIEAIAATPFRRAIHRHHVLRHDAMLTIC